MDQQDYEFLRRLVTRWHESYSTVVSVGRILRQECILHDSDQVFDYFEAPWHYESEIKDVIRDWEIDAVFQDFFRITDIEEREISLEWISAFGCSYETYKYLMNLIEDEPL